MPPLILSYLRMQSRARTKKSLLSWCSSRKRAHCSRVTDMDVRSLALLQLVNLMPFNLRQIWWKVDEGKKNNNITIGLAYIMKAKCCEVTHLVLHILT